MLGQFKILTGSFWVKSVFKILTFLISLGLFSEAIFAQTIQQLNNKTHLRWKVLADKEQIRVNKKGQKVIIQSLDPDFFERFSADVIKLKKDPSYHANYKFIPAKTPGEPFKLEIDLKDNSIELFSFYKANQGGHVLDFWINQDMVNTKEAALTAKPKKIKVAKLNPVKKQKKKIKKKSNKAANLLAIKKTGKFNIINPDAVIEKQTGGQFRDFRYGAAFIWDYTALIPPLTEDIKLGNKAPDFLYEVKDRKYLDDKREAHLQLSINFYRKKEWGLMTRSIKLFEEKYGRANKDINDFMKAVSMIRNTIKNELKPEYRSKVDAEGEILPPADYSQKGIMSAARNLLTNALDTTKDYELKKAILRYLIQYYRNENDHIQALNRAKSLYVDASEAFDDEMIIFSSQVILNSLAHLKQIDKIKTFLENKAVIRVLPKQVGLAYIGFINLSKDNTNQVLASYKANQAALVKPVHPSILYNTAEAYFRHAEYKKAVKLYDEFINLYSYNTYSNHARLRLALSYDLLNEPYKKVIQLYRDAINKSSDIIVQNEAKLRYVGLRVARNKQLDKSDLETIAFIDSINIQTLRNNEPKLQKLLWLTRLRTFISSKKYEEALAYLSTLPVENLRRVDQRSFNADGAEIILGIIQASYLKKDYARAVKVWEVYKNRYETKVARNPYMNFIVSDSFLNLGLFDSYQRAVKDLTILKSHQVRKFPIWVKAHKNISIKDYLAELQMNKYLKKGDYKGLDRYLEENKNNRNINYKYYKGLVSYQLKKYNECVVSMESLLISPNLKNMLTPEQNSRMLEVYLESLYESAQPTKFRKHTAALINDIRRSGGEKFSEILQRANYLYIESLFADKKIDYALLSTKTSEFLDENKESTYGYRVKYLRGVSLLNTENKQAGKALLEELISEKEVPNYLKGLARSELTALELNNRTL